MIPGSASDAAASRHHLGPTGAGPDVKPIDLEGSINGGTPKWMVGLMIVGDYGDLTTMIRGLTINHMGKLSVYH